jgi:hypothetical protein
MPSATFHNSQSGCLLVVLGTFFMSQGIAHAGCGVSSQVSTILPTGAGIDKITVFRGRDEAAFVSISIFYDDNNVTYGYEYVEQVETTGDRSTINAKLNYSPDQQAYATGWSDHTIAVGIQGYWRLDPTHYEQMPRTDQDATIPGRRVWLYYTSCTDPYPNTTVTLYYTQH